MKKTEKKSIEEIEKMAMQGEDVSKYFDTKSGHIGKKFNLIPMDKADNLLRANLDLTKEFADELDKEAAKLNISRQAVVKMVLREWLDKRHSVEKMIIEKQVV